MAGSSGEGRAALAAAFAGAASRYWLDVFPRVYSEARHWRRRASEIPDPTLRRLALVTLRAERGNLEGAAAFAVLVPRVQRPGVVRALVAFQAIYDYVDTLVEQPSADPFSNGLRLHQALLDALDRDARDCDYYLHHPRREDTGYLRDLVVACRTAFGALPSYTSLAASARQVTKRMVDYQSLNHEDSEDARDALAGWALTQVPPSLGLRWWETAAGAASSLVVFALVAAAAQPTVHADDAIATETAYFPWIGALHVLLDSLIDLPEDADAGQHSLVEHYASPEEIASRLRAISTEAVRLTRELPKSIQHGMILAAMTSFYLSDRQASLAGARPARDAILATMGDLAAPTMLVLGTRRAASRLARVTRGS